MNELIIRRSQGREDTGTGTGEMEVGDSGENDMDGEEIEEGSGKEGQESYYVTEYSIFFNRLEKGA